MLVLTRKYQEKIRIGDNITITVLRTKGKAVRLGIEAPSDVPVIRGELSFESEDTHEEAANDEASDGVCKPRVGVCRSETGSLWEAQSPRDEKPRVELKRLPRSEVRSFLPKLSPGSAPLRAMVNQRV
jgi:carbon storage regulator